MNLEDFQRFCEQKKGSELCFPFDDEHMVFKVGGKMFALAPISPFEHINLKCDPQKALELRAEHSSVIPGWHMNKKHWNTVVLDGLLSDQKIYAMIDHSYERVLASLPAKMREEIAKL